MSELTAPERPLPLKGITPHVLLSQIHSRAKSTGIDKPTLNEADIRSWLRNPVLLELYPESACLTSEGFLTELGCRLIVQRLPAPLSEVLQVDLSALFSGLSFLESTLQFWQEAVEIQQQVDNHRDNPFQPSSQAGATI